MKGEEISDLKLKNQLLHKLNHTLKEKNLDLEQQRRFLHGVKKQFKLRWSSTHQKNIVLAKMMQEINKLFSDEMHEITDVISLRRIPNVTTFFQKMQSEIPTKNYSLVVEQTKPESMYGDSAPFKGHHNNDN